MLGAEGVKSLVIDRLVAAVPTALGVRRYKTGASEYELPDVAAYYPAPEMGVQVGLWPFVTVHVDDTPGEISNEAPPPGSTEVIQEFVLEYNVIITVNAMVADASSGGALAARLQAERLALAVREALLQDRELITKHGEYEDWCAINYDRWVEDYGVFNDQEAGTWMGAAALKVPVMGHEFLDRAPYMDGRMYVVTALEVAQADPVTGAIIPETRDDKVDGDPFPKPV